MDNMLYTRTSYIQVPALSKKRTKSERQLHPRIFVTGIRGIPDIQGGIETHAENLYPLLKDLGCDIEIAVRRNSYKTVPEQWSDVRLRSIWAPRGAGIEAFLHTFFAVLYAGIHRPDIVHIHAVGPACMVPLARLLGLRVVFTHHGPDYKREKWGPVVRSVLRAGEWLGIKFANECIVISQGIYDNIEQRYGSGKTEVIPNGVTISPLRKTEEALKKFGLVRGKYIVQVSRFVPEKRHRDLIKAYFRAKLPAEWKLVLVGREDGGPCLDEMHALADGKPDVVFTDFQTGVALEELYTHAGLFVLPSSYEGLPIALLEAMSYGITALASDIAPNREVNLMEDHYFPVGDIETLSQLLKKWATTETNTESSQAQRDQVARDYDWGMIAKKTLAVYQRTI